MLAARVENPCFGGSIPSPGHQPFQWLMSFRAFKMWGISGRACIPTCGVLRDRPHAQTD